MTTPSAQERIVLGIDPGSHVMGLTVLRQGKPTYCRPLIAPSRLTALDRVNWLDGALEAFAVNQFLPDGPAVTLVTEHLVGHPVRQSASLEFVIQHLRQWAAGHKWGYVEYSPTTWRKVCAMKGMGQPTKQDVLWWAAQLYPKLGLLILSEQRGGLDAVESLGMATWHWDQVRVGIA